MSNFVDLVVEDDPFQREWLADLLQSEGLEVVESANGEVAELVLANNRPRTLGARYRHKSRWRNVRRRTCAVCQAPVSRPQRRNGLRAWSTRFLRKPYEPQQLLAAVLR